MSIVIQKVVEAFYDQLLSPFSKEHISVTRELLSLNITGEESCSVCSRILIKLLDLLTTESPRVASHALRGQFLPIAYHNIKSQFIFFFPVWLNFFFLRIWSFLYVHHIVSLIFSIPTDVNAAFYLHFSCPDASCCCNLPWMAGYWLLPTGAFSMS